LHRLHSARRSGRARAIGLLVAATLGVTIALQSPLGVLASGPTVTITTHFDPSPLTITAGQTVTWVNKDTSAHWVIADRNTFPTSGSIKPGGSYRFVFRQVGTYPYQDEYGNRSGTVIVTAAPPPTPTPKPTAKPTPRPTPRPTARPKATAKPTVKATPKPTPKPTKAPVVTASPTTAAVVLPTPGASAPPVAGAGTATEPAGSPGPGAATPVGSTGDGIGSLGLVLLLIALGGAAFVGGIWFARRGVSESPALVAEVAGAGAGAGAWAGRASPEFTPGDPLTTAGAGSAAAQAGAAAIATPPPPIGATRHQMPGDVVEDEPLQSARVEQPDEEDEL
jgi:plastocyanin